MKDYLKKFIENFCMLLISVYIKITICFIRAFVWALPIYFIWNKIITNICNAGEITYFQSYWICLFMMAFFTAIGTITINKK